MTLHPFLSCRSSSCSWYSRDDPPPHPWSGQWMCRDRMVDICWFSPPIPRSDISPQPETEESGSAGLQPTATIRHSVAAMEPWHLDTLINDTGSKTKRIKMHCDVLAGLGEKRGARREGWQREGGRGIGPCFSFSFLNKMLKCTKNSRTEIKRE